MLGLVFLIAMACWCWLGTGPLAFRWPLIVVIVLMTSGHWAGEIVGIYVDAIAGPALTLLFVVLGFMIMLRGFGWRSRRRHRHYDEYRYGRWFDGRRW